MTDLSMLRVDPRLGVAIGTQIRNGIALLMADGRLGPGERLPAVRRLAGRLRVNVNTVRAAYAKLAADGLVETRHGVGTVVLAPHPDQPSVGVPVLGSNTVAVLIGGLDPFYLPLLRGIEDVAAEHGMLVLFADTRDSAARADTLVRQLIARGVVGIIAVSACGSYGRQGGRRRAGGQIPPIVHVDQPDRTGHVVLFDARAAGRAATRHLAEHGHRRIGIVTAPLAWANVRQVYDGYAEALEASGVQLDPALLSEVGEFSTEAGRTGLGRLLDLADPPTAVFAAGEVLALGVLQEARARGVHVPGELAIAGNIDSPAAELVEPPLTMVAVPAREMGIRAMRVLAELLAGRDRRPRRTVLDVELVVRRSCGEHESGSSIGQGRSPCDEQASAVMIARDQPAYG